MVEKNFQLESILGRLDSLTSSEMDTLVKHIQKKKEERVEQRRKELWCNAVAALRKYTEEIGDIAVKGAFDEQIISVDKGYPGIIYIVE